ncbi:MAG: ROK family protein [Nibricoccus sp.]
MKFRTVIRMVRMDNAVVENQASRMHVLGIDIGGSAVKGAPVNISTGKLLAERHRIETPEKISPKHMARVVADIAKHFEWRGPIGIGFPGVVLNGVVKTAANVDHDFIDCDLGRLVAKVARCRTVKVINDADAAGVAEMHFGAGKGRKGTVMLFTLGTGVGSALFRHGVLVPNTELGHVPHKGHDYEKDVAASVRKDRGLSWHAWSKRLNGYLALMELLFSPDLIILGGGVSSKSEKFFPHLKTRAPLVAAQMHNAAGIVGAALHGGGKT